MTPVTFGILSDVVLWLAMAMAIGMPLYLFLRRSDPAVDWSGGGNVYASLFDWKDLAIAIGLAALLWATLAAGAEAAANGGGLSGGEKGLNPTNLLIAQFSMVILTAVLLLYQSLGRGRGLTELFGMRQLPLLRDFATAFGLLMGAFLLMALVALAMQSWLKGFWPEGDQQDTIKMIQGSTESFSWGDKFQLTLAIAILAPLTEEVIFRGFMYPALKRYTDRWFAMVVVSVFFSAIHMNMPAFVPLLLLAFGFTIAYEITGSLLTPFFMHALFNGFQLAALLHPEWFETLEKVSGS